MARNLSGGVDDCPEVMMEQMGNVRCYKHAGNDAIHRDFLHQIRNQGREESFDWCTYGSQL